MTDCECTPTCPFFHDQMADMPAAAELFKRRYCQHGGANCARHVVFAALGRETVPTDLYPDQLTRAQAIITTPS